MARQTGNETHLLPQLLLTVTEQLKLPLTQIARQAEQSQLSSGSANSDNHELIRIQIAADNALKLIDNYSLGLRLALEPLELARESVSVSSVLYDTRQQLDGLAKTYGVDLVLDVGGRFEPVQAHRAGLQAALVSLGAALIEALPAQAQDAPQQLRLQLATHRSRYGIVAGVYSHTKNLSSHTLQKGRQLQRHSRQPLTPLSHTPAAGVFVADTILNAMNLNLTASRHHGLYGLATVLQPNPQLQLV